MKDERINRNSKKWMQFEPTVVSDAISVAATNTTTAAVTVPIGAYVTKVAILSTVSVANVDIDIGDGDNVDRYMDGVTTLVQYNMILAPNVATGVDGTAGETGARYYAAADTIDVIENTTGSADTAVGSIKVLVWYYVP